VILYASCVVGLGSRISRSTMSETYKFLDSGYGKSFVKLLHIKREGKCHIIKEFEVGTQLSLESKKDYIHGDNTDIVATDSQKNTVYIMAKKHGVRSPEDFGLLLCSHFLAKYPHVNKVKVTVEQFPWKRIKKGEVKHIHAFLALPDATRFCTVRQERSGIPRIESGLKDMRVLKTTQSSFVNFINDEFRSLPDMAERIFSTVVFAKWEYFTSKNLDFDVAWEIVRDAILSNFAGPPETGVYSPSVQNTLFITQKEVLQKIPQVSFIEMEMPNKHYYTADFSKFPSTVGTTDNKEVFIPTEKPSGIIRCVLGRNLTAKM